MYKSYFAAVGGTPNADSTHSRTHWLEAYINVGAQCKRRQRDLHGPHFRVNDQPDGWALETDAQWLAFRKIAFNRIQARVSRLLNKAFCTWTRLLLTFLLLLNSNTCATEK